MFIVFEGIDGSGKTTISNLVARRLSERGVLLKHVRQDGKFASGVTEAIRALGRDSRHLELVPEAEFLLYVARDVQMRDEVLLPALANHELVIADRYFYTADNLGRYGRRLSRSVTEPVLRAATREVFPDLVVLIDVEPTLARARRKSAKIGASETKLPSRKGLTGTGLQHRLRRGYLEMAAEQPERWLVVQNDVPLEETVERLVGLLIKSLASGVDSALAAEKSTRALPAQEKRSLSRRDALERFIDWVDERALHEPKVAAWMLSGMWGAEVDERRTRFVERVPQVVLQGLRGQTDEVSWALRERLWETDPDGVVSTLAGPARFDPRSERWLSARAGTAPKVVLRYLRGDNSVLAWEVREACLLADPCGVLGSLAGLMTPEASELRNRLVSYGTTRPSGERPFWSEALARAISGLGSVEAWDVRRTAFPDAPVAVLGSLAGLTDERSWEMRWKYLRKATKVVMGTLKGTEDGRAWAMRRAVAEDCKESLEGLKGNEVEEAWRLREACADTWSSTVVKSLGAAAQSERGSALIERQLACFPGSISLWKHVAAIELGNFQVDDATCDLGVEWT